MFTIVAIAAPNGKIPGQKDRPQFFSAALGDLLLSELEEVEKGRGSRFGRPTRLRRVPLAASEMLEIAGRRVIPAQLQDKARMVLDKCASLSQTVQGPAAQDYLVLGLPLAVTYTKAFGIDPLVSFFISVGLGRRTTREALLGDTVPWNSVWAAKLTTEQIGALLKRFDSEVEFHEEHPYDELDHDLAYIIDPVKRILSGELADLPEGETKQAATSLLERAAAIYPAANAHVPPPGQRPDPKEIIAEIDEREKTLKPEGDTPPDDVPF